VRHGDDVAEADPRSRSNGQAQAGRNALPAGFVPSRWETVDPEEVQAQAVTSKWDIFDQAEEDKRKNRKGVTEPDDDDDVDGRSRGHAAFEHNNAIEMRATVLGIPMQEEENQLEVRLSEDRRSELRKIELKVMSYQDELEVGRQAVKPGWTISEMVRLANQGNDSKFSISLSSRSNNIESG
jgi:U2-associated protein SR140